MTKLHPTAEDERLLAEFAVAPCGRGYQYNGYRYDKWQDAVAYSNLMQAHPGQVDPGGPFAPCETVAPATDAQQATMVSLGIRFDDGGYRFEGFRYDELADAVDYARRSLEHGRERC